MDLLNKVKSAVATVATVATQTNNSGWSDSFSDLGYYVVMVHSTKHGVKSFRLPEDFGFNINTEWGSLYDEFSGSFPAISKLIKSAKAVVDMGNLITRGSENKVLDSTLLSARTFKKSSPIRLNFNFDLLAYGDAKEEVLKQITYLVSMCLPDPSGSFNILGDSFENVLGYFKLPGPSITDIANLNGLGKQKNWTGDIISIQIANYFMMQGVILTQVNPKFINKLDKNGKPMLGSVNLVFESSWTYTAPQLQKCFLM